MSKTNIFRIIGVSEMLLFFVLSYVFLCPSNFLTLTNPVSLKIMGYFSLVMGIVSLFILIFNWKKL